MDELVAQREVAETLVLVTSHHFAAGVVAREGKVIEVAPILRRHIKRGWSGRQVADYCKGQGWAWERVHTTVGRLRP